MKSFYFLRAGLALGLIFLIPGLVLSADPDSTETNPQSSSKSVLASIDSVNLSNSEAGTDLLVVGKNLKEPKVQKASGKKIVIKFSKTRLKIRGQLVEGDPVVKTVRSSMHGTTAWIVLDTTGVKDWSIEKSDQGYAFKLSSDHPLDGNEVATKNDLASSDALTNDRSPTDKGSLVRLLDFSLKPVEGGVKIVLTTDGAGKYTVRKLARPEKLVIHFHDTKLEISDKEKKLKESRIWQRQGLLAMEIRQIGQRFSPISEAILTLAPGTSHQVSKDLNQIVITLTPPLSEEKVVENKGSLNHLVSIDLEGADLTAVLKTLAAESGFDVDFVSPVAGVVNEKLKDVPLKTALADLLAPGLNAYEVQGNTIRIGSQANLILSKLNLPRITELISPAGGMSPAQLDNLVRPILDLSNAVKVNFDPVRNVIVLNGTASDIADYKRAIKDLRLDESSSSDRITRVVRLNYADPTQTQTILAPYLTPAGKVQVVIGPNAIPTNDLAIWETTGNMGVLLELIKEVDTKPPQVLIESHIVEVDNEHDLNMGVNWSINKAGGDPTISGNVSLPPNNASALPGLFTFGTIKSGFDINATLEALETRKKAKIVSRPRIATASGIAAEIRETENVIVSTTTQTTVPNVGVVQNQTFTQLPLPIDLKVTPRITEDGRITTVVNASITSQTGPAQGQGPPPTSIQTATTTITTKNGETIVIGGLVRETVQDTINGIPILSSIPIIGTLFQGHDRTNRKEELVIFITPTVLED